MKREGKGREWMGGREKVRTKNTKKGDDKWERRRQGERERINRLTRKLWK